MKKITYIFIIMVLIVTIQASETVDFLKENGTIDVSEIVAYLQRTGANWHAEENALTRMTESERESYLGYDFEEIDTTKLKYFDNIKIIRPGTRKFTKTTPDHWDWRDITGGDWTTDVRSQGGCGSCWAFAILATVEAAINITANEPDRDDDLSEEMLVHDCYPPYNCRGGNYRAYNFLLSNAICLEYCYPYTATNGACDPCINWEEESYKLDSLEVYSGSGHTPFERKEAIKEMLMEGPVSVAFTVLSDFFSYSGGVYNSTATPPYPNHGVAIIGYDERGPEPYWICKNSWGSGWGDCGYFNIHMGILHIDDFAYRPIFSYKMSLAHINNNQPIDNGYISSLTPELIWSIKAVSADVHFELQIDEDVNFETPITISSILSSIGFSPSLPTTFSSGKITYLVGSQGESLIDYETYWWRVRALHDGNYSHWSKSTSFTINTGISYDGWYQTTSEQFEKDIRSDFGLKVREDKVEKLYTGVLFETDFEYSNLYEFDAVWHSSAGEDSSGYSSDSLIDLLWYCDSVVDTFDVHSPNHCLFVSDRSTANCGYVYADIDTIQAARVDVWFYFELDSSRIDIIGIHCGEPDTRAGLVGKLFMYYWVEGYRFVYQRGSAAHIWGLDPSPYANEWHKYTLELDCSEEWIDPYFPYGTFPGVSRIYIDDTIRHECGIAQNYMNIVSFGTNLLYESVKGTGYYDDLSICGLGDSIAYLYSPSIIFDSTSYCNQLFWTQDIGADIEVELQYRDSGGWSTFNMYNTAGSYGEYKISGIEEVDTIRLVASFINISDSMINMYDWGVYWSDSILSENNSPIIVNCPETLFVTTTVEDSIWLYAYDPDFDSITLDLIDYPLSSWWDYNVDSTRPHLYNIYLRFYPESEDTGVFTFSIQACDTEYCDTCSFIMVVLLDSTHINLTPEITDCPTDTIEIVVGSARYLTLNAYDPDTDDVTMDLYEYPDGIIWWFDSLAGSDGTYFPSVYFNTFSGVTGFFTFAFRICDYEFCDSCEFFVRVLDTTSGALYIEVNEGWNLLSVPSSSPQPWSIYGNIPYGYDPSIADFSVSDSLHPGKGYFVLSTALDTVEIPSDLFYYTDTLYRGWNLLGGLAHACPSHNFITIPPGLGLSPFFGWDNSTYCYYLADSLYPGRGYWFLSSGHGRIMVGP